MPKKISIQGNTGSFHHIVAQKMFGKNIDIVERANFKQVFEDVKNKKVDMGVIAIENTIAGAILENYDLLEKYKLKIVDEYYLTIAHQLMALKGQKLKDIKEIHSHPMALKQCAEFLEKLPAKIVSTSDTAGSAKNIRENNLIGVAAIASALSAKIYGLEILAKDIQTNKKNFTRFLVLSRAELKNIKANKTSIIIETKNEPGSLSQIVNCFADNKINLTKLSSRPILGRPWEYLFYIDYQCDTKSEKGKKVLKELRKNSNQLVVLGSYIDRWK